MVTPTIPRRAMRVDLEPYAERWLATGEPAAMEWITWQTTRGVRLGTAEQVWRTHGEALLERNPDGCAHALRMFGKPRRRRSRKAA
jgi:hypothetical protein